MKLRHISSHSHTGSYSSQSCVEEVVLCEDFNVVLTVTKYENGRTLVNAVGGTKKNQAEAKNQYEEMLRIQKLEQNVSAMRIALTTWVAKHQNYRGGAWDYDKELDRLLTDSEALINGY